MGVAAHLKIGLGDYDRRIRSFIPRYDEMLEAAAAPLGLLRASRPTILDLGIGTGALAARCLEAVPRARLVGIDEDAEILAMARRRLAAPNGRVTFLHSSFEVTRLPRSDAIVASFALHHVRTRRRKRALYARCFSALRPGGLFVNADCCPSADARLATRERDDWRAHLRKTYDAGQATAFFKAWAADDVYFSLNAELSMQRDAGFAVDVVWRRGGFAVLVGTKRARRRG